MYVQPNFYFSLMYLKPLFQTAMDFASEGACWLWIPDSFFSLVCCQECVRVSSLMARSPDSSAGSLPPIQRATARLKVGHSQGTLPTDSLSAVNFEIDGTLAQ